MGGAKAAANAIDTKSEYGAIRNWGGLWKLVSEIIF